MIELEQLYAIYFLVTGADVVVAASPQRPFYIYVNNFSRKAGRLRKPMAIAHTTEPSTVIHAIHIKHQKGPWLETLEEDNQARPTHGGDVMSGTPVVVDGWTVHYKPMEDRESQILRDAVVGKDF